MKKKRIVNEKEFINYYYCVILHFKWLTDELGLFHRPGYSNKTFIGLHDASTKDRIKEVT